MGKLNSIRKYCILTLIPFSKNDMKNDLGSENGDLNENYRDYLIVCYRM